VHAEATAWPLGTPYSYHLVTPRSSMTLAKPIVPIRLKCKINLILRTATLIQATSTSSLPMKMVKIERIITLQIQKTIKHETMLN